MGTLINMVSVARPRVSFWPGNSIGLTARAASRCLDEAGIDPHDLGILINTGIYRYKNTGEPAIAALIQEKIAAGRTKRNRSGNSGNTFSFDLNNGGCGLLTGIEIVHGLINSGEISFGMVVTGDSEPFHGLSEEFAFNAAAAAIILSKSNEPAGFSLFRTYNYPDYSDEFRSCTFYNKTRGNGRGKNILKVMQKKSYVDFCVECAVKSLFNFLDESKKTLDEIDLIIPSQSPPGFVNRMKNHIDMNDKFIESSNTRNKMYHTAGPAFALKKVWDDNRFRNSRNIIFLTVGSGISVSITLYVNEIKNATG
jgi:3-oxoacyl-[acyl-carrier-protein] synthase III